MEVLDPRTAEKMRARAHHWHIKQPLPLDASPDLVCTGLLGNLWTLLDREVEAWLPALPGHCHLRVSFSKVTNNPSPTLYLKTHCLLRSLKRSLSIVLPAKQGLPASGSSKRLKTHVSTPLPVESPSQRALPEARISPTLESLAPVSMETKALFSHVSSAKGPKCLTRKEKLNCRRVQEGLDSRAPRKPPFPRPNDPTPSFRPTPSGGALTERSPQWDRTGSHFPLEIRSLQEPARSRLPCGWWAVGQVPKVLRPGTRQTGNSTCWASAPARKGQWSGPLAKTKHSAAEAGAPAPAHSHTGGAPAPTAPAKSAPLAPGRARSGLQPGGRRCWLPRRPAPSPTSGRELYLSPAPRSLEPPAPLRP